MFTLKIGCSIIIWNIPLLAYAQVGTQSPLSVPERDLSSVVRPTIVDKVQRSQAQSFKEFRDSTEVIPINQARAGIRSDITEQELEKAKSDVSNFYKNLDVVATIQLPVPNSKDVISYDCVPEKGQPANKDLIEAGGADTPPSAPDQTDKITNSHGLSVGAAEAVVSNDPKRIRQNLENAACPINTVPIRRTTIPEVLSIHREPHPTIDRGALRDLLGRKSTSPSLSYPHQHRYAHAIGLHENHGIMARLNVWSPKVLEGDMSLSQVWVVGGDPDQGNLQTVEAGWQVMKLWRSPFSALFVYSTADNYTNTGCYASHCQHNYPIRPESFKLKNNKIILGKPLEQQSSLAGSQAIVEIAWVRKPETGNWWLRVNDQWVGYYPKSFFKSGPLSIQGDYVDFGGEATGSTPTSEMGSGKFPDAGKGHAAFQSRLSYVNADGIAVAATVRPYVTHEQCYSITVNGPVEPEDNSGTYIYFGGPGINARNEVLPRGCR
ncbi:MAG: neprosin family prolyl endopeptidase [Pseudomonadota bacterium]